MLNISDYQSLYAVIGTTYGGDGQTTFALPDLRGRSIVGASSSHPLGEEFGSETATVINSNLPTGAGGQDSPINNDQPSLAMNYIICLDGIFPDDGGSGTVEVEPIWVRSSPMQVP